MRKAIQLLTALASLTIAAHATSWTVYHDQDFSGYTITYPSFLHFVPWRVVLLPDEEDDHVHWHTLVYASEDGVKLQFQFFYCDASTTVQSFFRAELKERQDKGDKVTYSVVKNNWYVVSGVDASRNFEFYKKLIVLPPKDGNDMGSSNSFDFSYPEDQRKKYDPMVSVIAKGFIP
jgi:hypothetical protein